MRSVRTTVRRGTVSESNANGFPDRQVETTVTDMMKELEARRTQGAETVMAALAGAGSGD